MFSGKTSSLINELVKWYDIDNNLKIILINNSIDTRDSRNIVSCHSSNYSGIKKFIKIISSSTLSNIDVSSYDIIGLDEISFYEKNDLVESINKWIGESKKIICSGLNSNYKMEKFGFIDQLLPISDEFIKLNAICKKCFNIRKIHQDAPFTKRIISDENEVVIGKNECYESVCRYHYYK
jgi:thymidine kinase